MIRKLVSSLRSVVFVVVFFSFTSQAISQSSLDARPALDRWRVELGWQHANGRFFLSPAAPSKRNAAAPAPEDRLPLAYNTNLIASVNANVYLANASATFANGNHNDPNLTVKQAAQAMRAAPNERHENNVKAVTVQGIYRSDASFAKLPPNLVFAGTTYGHGFTELIAHGVTADLARR